MGRVPWILLFFFLQAATAVWSQECIKTLVDIERSILLNGENLQSLIRAFYPANQYPALWIEVQYYINGTNDNDTLSTHPAAYINEGNPPALEPNYTFYWASSPVLIYLHPRLLEGMSLQFVRIYYHSADLVISSFCDGLSQNAILTIINDATIWLKSYAVMKSSSLDEGIDPDLQGYTAYLPDQDSSDFFVLHREEIYQRYAYGLIVALIVSVTFVQLIVPILIWHKYSILQRYARMGLQHKHQRFRFKSIFWAGVTVLAGAVTIIIGLDLYNIITFGLRAMNNEPLLYNMILAGFGILLTLDTVFSIVITVKAGIRNELIELPKLFMIMDRLPSIQKVILLFFQFYVVMTLLLSSLATSFHASGIILAVLANPIQVSATAIMSVMMMILILFLLTYIFEKYEVSEKKWRQFLEAWFQIFLGALFVAFIVIFSIVYLNAVLYTGADNTGVVGSLAQIFPAILLGLTGWLVKREYDGFVGTEQDEISDEKETNEKEEDVIELSSAIGSNTI